MLVLIKIAYCNIYTRNDQCWESSRVFKILSAGHVWPTGL